MSKRLASLALILVFATSASGKKDASQLLAQLQTDFVGKQFTSKIMLGGYWRRYDPAAAMNLERLIDTEIYFDGQVKYWVRAAAFLSHDFLQSFYIRPDAISRTFSAGSKVWVQKVELKGDRIELWLSGVGPTDKTLDSYAKVKVMLGNNFQQSLSYDDIMMAVSKALRIEKYERLQELNTQYTTLLAQLGEAERTYQNAQNISAAKLQAATQLVEVLRMLAQNRTEYSALGRTDSSPATYSQRANELESEIRSLEQQVRIDQIKEVRRILQTEAAELTGLKSVLQQQPPSTLTEWQQRSEALSKYKNLLTHRQTLYSILESAEEPMPAAELTKLQEEVRWADELAGTLSRDRQRLELLQLDTEYRAMERRRGQLLDAYTRAFATPNERQTLATLLQHLQRMQENRAVAQQMGYGPASRQAAELQQQIEKLRRR